MRSKSPPEINADELRAELARRRWTQRALADRVGVSPALIGLICSGWRGSARVRARIVQALGPLAASRVAIAAVEEDQSAGDELGAGTDSRGER